MTAHKQREGGGFVVRRPVGGEVDQVDPFLMLDHLGPTTYAPGEAVGGTGQLQAQWRARSNPAGAHALPAPAAPDHPHRGFETVTIVLQGGMQHQDSVGNTGNLVPGAVQWMTAGAGVVHSEMPSDKLMKEGGTLEGFQVRGAAAWRRRGRGSAQLTPRHSCGSISRPGTR